MSGSLSHTPTISQPSILRICEACASAILPQPTMATLSTLFLPAGHEVTAKRFLHLDLGLPSQLGLQLVIAVAGLLPFSVPAPAVEHRRQLALRPMGILFP